MTKFQVILNFDESLHHPFQSIEPGTEVTIHTNDGSYYEATFQYFDRKSKHINIYIDRFYPNGGKEICLDEQDVISVQTPDESIDLTEEEIE